MYRVSRAVDEAASEIDRQLVEMRDHLRRLEIPHRLVGIAEINRDDRDACGLRRVDVRSRIADHQCPFDVATCCFDGAKQVPRVGLTIREGVLAADRGEVPGQAERLDQQLRMPLYLVGADCQPVTGGGKPVQCLDDARIRS